MTVTTLFPVSPPTVDGSNDFLLFLSNVKTVALTRAPEKCRWKSRHKFRRTFHTQTHWCRRRGVHPQNFLFVQIREKSLKIREKYVEIWPKCVNTFAISLYMLWFYKKVQTFFVGAHVFIWFFSGKFGNIWAKMVLGVLWFEKIRPTWKKCVFFVFFIFVFFGWVFGQVCGNMGKNPLHPQI